MGSSRRDFLMFAALTLGSTFVSQGAQAEIAQSPSDKPSTPPPSTDANAIKPEPFEMKARPVALVESKGNWDDAEDLLNDAFKEIFSALADKSLHAAGLPMVEYLDSNDKTFAFRAMVPVDAPPDTDFGEDVQMGMGPSGPAIKVSHEGPFDELEQVYNRIDDYLAGQHLQMDRVVEEYATDQSVTAPNKQVTNIYVFTKKED